MSIFVRKLDLHLINGDVTDDILLVDRVRQKEDVASVESRFH